MVFIREVMDIKNKIAYLKVCSEWYLMGSLSARKDKAGYCLIFSADNLG